MSLGMWLAANTAVRQTDCAKTSTFDCFNYLDCALCQKTGEPSVCVDKDQEPAMEKKGYKCFEEEQRQQSPPRPHIVYMLTDNIGYGNLGYIRAQTEAGPSREVDTPKMDALAGGGVILDRLYSYEFCSPSRSSLLSGRLPGHVNIHNDLQTRPGAGIPAQMATMPSKMAGAGYRTHHIGARQQ